MSEGGVEMNGVARAYWAEVYAGSEPPDGRLLPPRPRRRKARLVRTLGGRIVQEGRTR